MSSLPAQVPPRKSESPFARRARLLRALQIEWIWADKRGLHTAGTPLLPSLAALIQSNR
jgi:hypothetical protein